MHATLCNPFHTWASLADGLRARFVGHLALANGGKPTSPYAGALVGALAGIVRNCEHLGLALEDLRSRDAAAYEAFLRALEEA